MEIGDFTQTTIAVLEGSGNLEDIVGNPFTSSEGFLSVIFQNSVRFRSALVIFLLRILALIRVIKDANARSSSFRFTFLAILLVIIFTPVFGILLYIAIRPQGRKWDKTPRRDTTFQQIHVCENCGNFNLISHAFCSNCGEGLQCNCRECQKQYSKSYAYCPHCGAPHLEE